MSHKNTNTQKSGREKIAVITVTGILAAQALACAFAEKAITSLIPLPMGVKPGLSNIVVMFACSSLGFPYALGIALIKAGFTFLLSGGASGFIALAGGLFSVGAMALTLRIKKRHSGISYTGISVISAVAHNFGQLSAASLMIGSALYLSYAPVLLLSGIIFGSVTGIILNFVMPVLNKQKSYFLKK